MKDYWIKLKHLNSTKDRFNYIMDYIDTAFAENTTTTEVETGTVNVSIKNSSEEGISQASVVLSIEGNETTYTGTTGTQGGCNITSVPYGEYTVNVTHDDYETYTGTVTVDAETIEFNQTLTAKEVVQNEP